MRHRKIVCDEALQRFRRTRANCGDDVEKAVLSRRIPVRHGLHAGCAARHYSVDSSVLLRSIPVARTTDCIRCSRLTRKKKRGARSAPLFPVHVQPAGWLALRPDGSFLRHPVVNAHRAAPQVATALRGRAVEGQRARPEVTVGPQVSPPTRGWRCRAWNATTGSRSTTDNLATTDNHRHP